MADVRLDFDGAIQYYVAKKIGVGEIVSFDRHFDKLDIDGERTGSRTFRGR